MASTSALTTVQKLYIAYYGRAADAAGQLFWADKLDAAGGSLVGVIDAFATSAEAQALYGSGTTNAARITTLYQNILGRNPDTAGLNYYVDQVNRGKLSLGNAALAILDGVRGTDLPLAANRMTVANSFTAQVSTAPKSYDGDVAAAIARTFLKSVTGDAATVTEATNQLDAYLNTIGVASKEPAKFASFVANGLFTNPALVSSTLSVANLDEVLKALTPTTGATTGKIIDGYIKGATVFADADGDGIQDPGEVSTVTDDKGNFTLPAGAVGNLVSIGGTDISTNLPFKGVLTAPAGSTVVNPITTLVNNLVQSGQSATAAQQKVTQALGLPTNVDVTKFDPLNVATSTTASAADKQAALAVQKAAATVANILVQTASAVAGAAPSVNQGQVAAQAAKTLATLISTTATGQTLDLTSTATLNSVLNDAGKNLNAEDKAQLTQVQSQVVQVMLATNEALEKVGTTGTDPIAALTQMAQAQVVAQGSGSTALQNSVQTGDATQATNSFTGANLNTQVNAAQPGMIGENVPAKAPDRLEEFFYPAPSTPPIQKTTIERYINGYIPADWDTGVLSNDGVSKVQSPVIRVDLTSIEQDLGKLVSDVTYKIRNSDGLILESGSLPLNEIRLAPSAYDIQVNSLGFDGYKKFKFEVEYSTIQNLSSLFSGGGGNLNLITLRTNHFTYFLDTTAPKLEYSSPVNTEFGGGAGVYLKFNELISSGEGSIFIGNGSNNISIDIKDTTQVKISGSTITISPSVGLLPDVIYNVQMAPGVLKDMAGNLYAGIDNAATVVFASIPNAAPRLELPISPEFAANVGYSSKAPIYSLFSTATNSATSADLNGDGRPDIIAKDSAIGVLINKGDGNFNSAVNYPGSLGGGHELYGSVITADVNNDGKQDLLVAQGRYGIVSVLLGNGDGSFNLKSDYKTGEEIKSIHISDVNLDGVPDLLVADNYQPYVSVLLGNGDGTFHSKIDYRMVTGSSSVTSADVNGDGKPDMLVANNGMTARGVSTEKSTVSVLLGKGDGTFNAKVDYVTGIGPQSLISVDVNGDRKPDLVTANGSSSTVSVLLGKGDGTFHPKVDYATGNGTASVSSADVNGDGKPDLLVANFHNDTVSVLTNKGDGTFNGRVDYATGNGPRSVSSADFNGDGKPDLLVANWGGTVSVLINTRNGFVEGSPVAINSSLTLSDPNGDIDWNGGTLKVQITANASADDRLRLPTTNPGGNGIWMDGTTVKAGTTAIGTASAPNVSSDSAWSFTLNASATNALVQDLGRAILFDNQSDTPSTATRSITFTATDKWGLSSTASMPLTVTALDDAPTGSVTITGTATQGQTLSAASKFGLTNYQWLANGIEIAGATKSTYTLTQAEVGKAISVVASYTDSFNTTGRTRSTPTAAVANVNDLPTGAVTISGTATQGQTLTAANTLADTDGLGAVSYQWNAGGVNIAGATNSTYTLTQAEVGKAITVTASYTDGRGTTERVNSAATSAVVNVNDLPTGSVTINGKVEEGGLLTVGNTLTDADGLGSISYQWKAGGVSIAGATDSSYTLTQAEVGKTITVAASYTDGQGTAERVSSLATVAVANVNGLPTGSVTVTGTAAEGGSLKAANTLADADGLGRIRYQWQLDGTAIAGATTDTLAIPDDQSYVGKAITVVASYTDGFNTAESVSSAPLRIANVNDAPVGGVSIGGTAKQGETLVVTQSLADADGLSTSLGTIRYQWQADGVNIPGVLNSTFSRSYTLTQAEVGKAITVVASYIDGQGTSESVSSAPTVAVANVNDLPTGDVTITGDMQQGKTLTVSNTLADDDGLGTVRYQWQANNVDIQGATDSSLTLTQAEVGKFIFVVASYTDGFNTKESVIGYPSSNFKVGNVNDPPTGTLTINGTAAEGQTLTVANTVKDADNGISRIDFYHWKADGVYIPGAGGPGYTSYTLTQAEVGKAITVEFRYRDGFDYPERVLSAPTAPVTNVNDSPTGSVTITGTATQGQTLTAANTLADADGLGTISYQWKAGGVNIAGATSSTYTLTQAEVGKAITVVASYTDGQGTAESVSSAATTSVANINDLPSGSVTITGTATQGQTLTAANTLADADGLGTISYQWKAGGVNIAGATNSTYTLTQAEVGKAITVVASYTDGQGTAESVSSATTAAVANVNDAPTGAVTIAGTAAEGGSLKAANTLADADGLGSIGYQWQLDGTAIAGATTDTLAIPSDQSYVGKAITVVASYTDGFNTAESVSSSAMAAVANVNDAPTGSVTITGTATQGQTLTAANTLADDDGLGTISYQWKAGGVNIAGATSSSYTLTQAEVGKAITVVASYTDGFGTAESVSSSATAAVANVNDAPTGTVTITGTAVEGGSLKAANTLADADGLGSISYQWQLDGTAIAAATTDTLTIPSDQSYVGKTITVVASYTDGQGTAESVNSSATAAVANVNDEPTGSVTITGTAEEGGSLKAANTLADADGLGSISYQWQLDGTAIAGATTDTLAIPSDQSYVGKAITVVASFTDGFNTAESVSSSATAAVANVNDAPTGGVNITGTATQGQTLTATNTLADADGLGTLRYQWKAGGVDISGATNNTHTLTQAEVGKTITVTVSYTDAFNTQESVSSASTAPVLNINDTPTGAVSMFGEVQEGSTVSADSTLADADGLSLGAISYQWYLDGQLISGATANTLTIPSDQSYVGKALSVVASYTDGFNTTERVSSAAITVANVNDAPTFTLTSGVTVVEDAPETKIGLVVATYTTPVDEDADTVTVAFTPDSNVNGIYALDTARREVTLTQAGVAFVNAGIPLPQISLTATDNDTPSASSQQTATPTTTLVDDPLRVEPAFWVEDQSAEGEKIDLVMAYAQGSAVTPESVAFKIGNTVFGTASGGAGEASISYGLIEQPSTPLFGELLVTNGTTSKSAQLSLGLGTAGANTLSASASTQASVLYGFGGNDTLTGGGLADTLAGGVGADVLTGGGGADLFVFTMASDSVVTAFDQITDFTSGTDQFKTGVMGGAASLNQGEAYTFAGTGNLASDLTSAVAAGNAAAPVHTRADNDMYVLTITGTGAGRYVFQDRDGNGTVDTDELVIQLTGTSSTTLALLDFVE